MPRKRLRAAIALGAAVVSAALVGGASLVLDRTWRTARRAAEASAEHAAQLAANTVNRQLLPVDSALASLPALFAAVERAGGNAAAPDAAGRLLRSFSFQNLAFRDLLLVRPDGSVWASARPRPSDRFLPVDAGELAAARSPGSVALSGPARNPLTGEWALFLARPVALAGPGSFLAVAEVPLSSIAAVLAEAGAGPGLRVVLEAADGRLLASLPHDELATGAKQPLPFGGVRADGRAFDVPREASAAPAVAAFRPTLYGDVGAAAIVDGRHAFANWGRDRNNLLAVVALVELLVLGSTAILLAALRRQDELERDGDRARTMLENAVAAMSDGFVMWDADDRLVACNNKYRELYALSAPAIRPGASFEEIMRFGLERGQYPQAGPDKEAWLREVTAWHRNTQGALERLLPDGRWLLITERRTATGEIVGIRTDITALKAAHGELERANGRVREAMAALQEQNAALREGEGRIRFLAHHDALTRLPNRVLFRSRLEGTLRGLDRSKEELALLCLDLDKFKNVNDTLGHPAGDALLEAVGGRLRGCLAGAEVVARLGGDEFAAVCVAPDAAAEARELAGRIIAAVGAPYDLQGRTVTVGVSVGVALAGDGATDADTLLKNADMALYEAKAAGRGVCRFFDPAIEEQLRDRLEMEGALRAAVTEERFGLAYQPIFDLGSGRACGFEALLRWEGAKAGVGPARFIPLAEEMGLIGPIGSFVLHRACADAVLLPRHLRIAVNLSPVQLRSDEVVAAVAAALERSGLDPTRLELEITESALLDDSDRITARLHRLREMGARIVLDDFGTGFSSLSYLRRFPFDKLKIDQSFVREMTTRANSAAIVGATVDLADRLGMTTTAEGVETADHLDVVRRAGCVEAQGYFLGAPKPILHAFDALRLSPFRPGAEAARPPRPAGAPAPGG